MFFIMPVTQSVKFDKFERLRKILNTVPASSSRQKSNLNFLKQTINEISKRIH